MSGRSRFCSSVTVPGLRCFVLGDPRQAEHAMQEAVLMAWQERARARASPSARIWLYRIAVRVCSDALESDVR